MSLVLKKSISAEAVGRSLYAFLRTRLCDMLLVYHQSDVIFRLSLYSLKMFDFLFFVFPLMFLNDILDLHKLRPLFKNRFGNDPNQ